VEPSGPVHQEGVVGDVGVRGREGDRRGLAELVVMSPAAPGATDIIVGALTTSPDALLAARILRSTWVVL
jgi:hypothetical protein